MTRSGMRALLLALVLVTSTACAGWGGGVGAGGPNSINVLMVNNPQMVDLQRLTAEHFTKQTGITVNFTVLPENDVRDKISQEFSSQAGQYDVATVSNFEVPIYARSRWIAPLDDFIAADPGFDQADILGPMTASLTAADGKIYGEPFYGESSFLMYRADVLAEKGLTMPAKPTWDEVARLAAQLDGARPGMKGICLRGQPGWGQVFAPLTTVVNTFGGTWFTADWRAQVNAPEFTEAVQFYVDLVRTHGEIGAPQAGFTECLNNMIQGNVAMWYDATSAAGSLEAADSPVRGKIGYSPAPVKLTESSGWLYAWSWAIQNASTKKDHAWKFISWASSKEYERLVGERLGWSKVPAGKRASTYENPDYLAESAAFAAPTKAAIESADPRNPGVQPRPALGIQFVDIPEFPDLGTQVSLQISSAIAGQVTVEQALDRGQQLAEDVAERYRSRLEGNA
ncbi:carbohydrate ABC transporter substrate-binding protein, CUT1 family [Pseudonocardia thermophila]|jgi:ABC-type sugar transport system, periplasmic component|uniref:Carbohydrate ABC transporter substrate-binding protein, CUT1 family n=1 Tax=Pseudonocardia thermophila TaxID=1848 RepID=A0A1M6YMW8_PSETH|nr:sugar ABC transporter substrate-binding protein [Pseudonocardia thermophila]SHL19379.1 carbohydrate ABC transporter substrate-binding protein, CUT1 family [Pseudonocardia thermophila]